MIQTINSSDFMHAFHSHNRYDQFGYEALNILFEYFEEVNPDMELDVIALCCEYSHESWRGIASDYDIDVEGITDDDEGEEIVREWLNEHTVIVGETDTGFVYCSSF
jgi:hypothetical protein